MSEYKSEKVYLHYVDGAPILVDSLGMRIGVQGRLDLIGDAGGFHSAVVKLEIDGKWSQEVANDFVSAGGRPVVKKDVYRDSAYEYLHRFGLQDFKVINGQDGIEMEISCMSNPDFVMVNGKKYLPDGARGDNGKPDPVKPIESTELNSDRRVSGPLLTEVENILCVDTEIPVDSALINGEKFVREQSPKTESKLSVEVDTSAPATVALEEVRKRWKERLSIGSVHIEPELTAFDPFPICPLESAISETVRHLREGQEFNLKAPPEVQRPDEPNQMLAQHLKKLLSAQYERMSK